MAKSTERLECKCKCGKSFANKYSLWHHEAQENNPEYFQCPHTLEGTGQQCPHKVKGQKTNPKEHIENKHQGRRYRCRICGCIVASFSYLSLHLKCCAGKKKVAIDQTQDAINYYVEFELDNAPEPATGPVGWVRYGTHSGLDLVSEVDAYAVELIQVTVTPSDEAPASTTQPVAGPSGTQHMGPPHPTPPVVGTSVPSTIHCNEVNTTIIQSQQTPGASSSSTTAPLYTGFTTSENQLDFPPYLIDNIAARRYQQPSLPFHEPNQLPSAQRRTRSSQRYRPYAYQGLSQSETSQWSTAPHTSMADAVPVPSQPIPPSASRPSGRALTAEYFGRLYPTREDALLTPMPTIAGRLPASHHQPGLSRPQTGSNILNPLLSNPPPSVLQADHVSLQAEWNTNSGQISPRLQLPTPQEWLTQSSPLPHGLSADLNPDTMLDGSSTPNPAYRLGHPSMGQTPSGGDAWDFSFPEYRDRRTAMPSTREELQNPSFELPYDMTYQFQPANSSVIGASTHAQMNSSEANRARSQDVFGEGAFSGYGFGDQSDQGQAYQY